MILLLGCGDRYYSQGEFTFDLRFHELPIPFDPQSGVGQRTFYSGLR